MKFNARGRRPASVINLTPLIDCMFLLVIFIMLAARFDADTGMDVDLPSASQTATEPKPQLKRIELTVTREGNVYIDGTEIDPAVLQQAIIAAREQNGDPSGTGTALVISGDKEALYDRMVMIMDAARAANQLNFFFRTQ